MRIWSRKSNAISTSLLVFGVILGGLVCAPLLSTAHTPSTSVTIVNNSGTDIRHVYLSPVDQDNWGNDQLSNSTISSGGGSTTLNNLSCEAASVKVVAEDTDGCFFYKVVTCSQASTWTISSSDTRDCGN
jgi:hypothetical protein